MGFYAGGGCEGEGGGIGTNVTYGGGVGGSGGKID